ncbi:SNF1-related protein kinase regulatory subunit gamma-like PV42a isoform X4 [Cornus florida]|uniref:SNF1-related protein kinase regulatory subunit gamma-like PV42a isoform X4 n=1 Tax=Cornus florida TaxID=4283 RepID=UPI00289CFE45|nr:SNF1-related protein kinase regulatory subunit gamma-like PV42a isoform X4 [Cornus florida]
MSSNGSENQQMMMLKDKKVIDVLAGKSDDYKRRRLVETPYTASLGDTMNALLANKVVAVPVAAPPGHWIGAGGSMILESDKQTGAVRKHYIGMVTMLDVLSHIADDDFSNIDQKMSVPVSSIIGHCLESLSLWTLNPNTSIIDCMEVFSKGIHRVLVPIDSHVENVAGVELVESASSYQMLTQMDLVRFLMQYHCQSELNRVMSRPVRQLGALCDTIFAVTDRTSVIEAIKCMRAGSLNAIPIVESSNSVEEDLHGQLINGNGRKLVGTFSSTDLRECRFPQLQSGLPQSVLEFTEKLSANPLCSGSDQQGNSPKELVTCFTGSWLGEVIDKAVSKHVHRVWVVDEQGLLVGIVSLTDMIRMIRVSIISEF